MAVDAAGKPQALPSYLEHRTRHTGILSWVLSTDHKRIGILYLVSQLSFFLVGMTLGFLMRLEMLLPGDNHPRPGVSPRCSRARRHMIFLVVIPGLIASVATSSCPS